MANSRSPQKSPAKLEAKGRSRFIKHSAIIAVLLLVLMAIAVILWPKIMPTLPNETYYSADKNVVKNKIETLLATVKPKGQIVYSSIEDRGCDDSGSVGLATAVKCDYVAYKYAIHHGSISADMHEIDAMITRNNWGRRRYSNQLPEEFERALDGKIKTSLHYQPLDNKHIAANLGYYLNNKEMDDYTIQELIQNKKIPAPKPGEYVYGVSVTGTYWTCRDLTSHNQLCPAPPSKPR